MTKDDRFRDTVSHQKVAAMLRGIGVPRWSKLESVVLVLAEWSTPGRNPSEEVQRLKKLWDATTEAVGNNQSDPSIYINTSESASIVDKATEEMTLNVLGCSGNVPGPRVPTSGYLLKAEDFVLAMELGAGTLATLQSLCSPFDIEALLISHLHADHCADVAPLTILRRYHPSPPRDSFLNKLPVHAPIDAPGHFAAAYSTSKSESEFADLSDVYEFHALRTGRINIGPFEIDVIQAAHPCDAYSFRISNGGRSLVFTGDSEMTEQLIELATQSNTLLAEACRVHADAEHWLAKDLSGKQAGELARRSGTGRLLLTHVPPWVDARAVLAEARAEFPGETLTVEVGKSYAI